MDGKRWLAGTAAAGGIDSRAVTGERERTAKRAGAPGARTEPKRRGPAAAGWVRAARGRLALARRVLFLAAVLATPASATEPSAATRRVEIRITESGFEPQEVKVKKGESVTLVFTRTTDATCITAIDIPDENVKHLDLPLKKPVSVTITPKKPGVEKFHCSAMAMGDGRIVVSD